MHPISGRTPAVAGGVVVACKYDRGIHTIPYTCTGVCRRQLPGSRSGEGTRLQMNFGWSKKMGLRGVEWVIFVWIMPESCAFPRFFALRTGLEIANDFAWQEPGDEGGGCGTRIASPGFGRNRQCTAFSVIRKRV